MVHIPVLKIDVPDPDISALIPAAVSLGIGAITAVHDAVHGFLHPMSPQAAAAYEAGAIAALPREMRHARKRIAERRIDDIDKQSSELEEAAFSFYRRMIRTNCVGFSDEVPEDTTFRRLTLPGSPGESVQNAAGQLSASAAAEGLPPQLLPAEVLVAEGHGMNTSAAAAGEAFGTLPSAQRAGSRGHHRHQGQPQGLSLPGVVQRTAVTTAAGGAGLAVGLGLVRLAAMLVQLKSRSGKRRAKRGSAVKGGPARSMTAAAGASGRGRRSGGSAVAPK